MAAAALSEGDLAAFQRLAYEVAGIHLADNKREMLATRLARRLHALGLPGYRAYYQLLTTGDPTGDEREHFINAITTNKTSFFREPHHFDFLRDQVIPELRERVAAGAPKRLRIWSCACSTGEEPYSIAMIAHRELARDGYAIEIVASDIDTEVLSRAHDGHYTSTQLAEIPADHRSRYFEPGAHVRDPWQVRDELRALLQFHHVNLIHDAFPFSGPFDAIFIRNVIIYFDRPSQGALFRRLRGYLADTSYLFLGHSESLLYITDAFAPAGRTIYRPRVVHRSDAATSVSSAALRHPGLPGASAGALARRRGRATITPMPGDGMVASAEALRLDATVGPSVATCAFDPQAKVGGMVQLRSGEPDRAAEQAIRQLAARLVELGASLHALRAKLVGGGGVTPGDRAAGEHLTGIAERVLHAIGIPLASKRVGGHRRLEIQFFTGSGRLLCRDHEPAERAG